MVPPVAVDWYRQFHAAAGCVSARWYRFIKLCCSKRSVAEVSKAVKGTGKSYGELLALSDDELKTIFSPAEEVKKEDPRKAELEALMPEVAYSGHTRSPIPVISVQSVDDLSKELA